MNHAMSTTRVVEDLKNPKLLRRKLKLEVLKGPNKGLSGTFGEEEVNVGSLPSNHLVLTDSAVSRYHLRLSAGARGFIIKDLDSTNGTFFQNIRISEITITEPIDLRIGDCIIRITPLSDEIEVPLYQAERFGSMVGQSPQMRAIFAQLAKVSSTEATVLIESETGTGKELLAEEIHKNSSRHKQPFIVVDCGAIPEHLIESELFGHVRGAFTSANADRTGAFELADKGTLFLDEIGELSATAQPKLLRVLENRQVKPVGSSRYRPVNVRIIAATNRDLRLCVNEGTFRPDLFYRLSVVRIHLPPLRERPEDIELLAKLFMNEFWNRIPHAQNTSPPFNPETIQRLIKHRWSGNVRELRNFMERVVVLARSSEEVIADLEKEPAEVNPQNTQEGIDLHLPYKEAKLKWIDQFEMTYVTGILQQNGGNVAAASRQAGVDRTYLFRLIRKYNLRK